MPYNVQISGLDLAGNLGEVQVGAGYVFNVAGSGEQRQFTVTQNFPGAVFGGGSTMSFGYAGSFAPPPAPHWDIGLAIQEVSGMPAGGWLFRSERYQTEPPSDPIEVIIAPETTIGPADLAAAIGTLPQTSGSTTITALTLAIAGVDIAFSAAGTDTGLPAGVTFTYSATLRLLPNGDNAGTGSPFKIALDNPNLGFTAGVGTGFVTAILNLFAGIIHNEVAPRIHAAVSGRLNAGVLSSVATRLNRGVPTAMPAGVVLSIRRLRATTGPSPAGPVPMIGVFGALGAFGGVLNKFPPIVGSSRCFVVTASTGPDSVEVAVLRAWRDAELRRLLVGRWLIAIYERLSPPLAAAIASRPAWRARARRMVVGPAARWAARRLRDRNDIAEKRT